MEPVHRGQGEPLAESTQFLHICQIKKKIDIDIKDIGRELESYAVLFILYIL